MAKTAGRDYLIKKNDVTIAGVRVVGMTWAGQPIDVTDQGDDGITTYLGSEFANETLEISVEGVEDGDVLADLAFGTTSSARHLTDITIDRPNGDTVSGTFIMTNYAETGNYQEATTFTASLVRSGIHTLTPGA